MLLSGRFIFNLLFCGNNFGGRGGGAAECGFKTSSPQLLFKPVNEYYKNIIFFNTPFHHFAIFVRFNSIQPGAVNDYAMIMIIN